MTDHCEAACERCLKRANAKVSLGYPVFSDADPTFRRWNVSEVAIEASFLELMRQIKAEHPADMTCPEVKMKLYVTKKQYRSPWLSDKTYSRSLDNLGHDKAHEIKKYTVESMRMRRARRLDAYFSHDMRPKQTVQVSCAHFIVCLPEYSEPMYIAAAVQAQSPAPTYDIADLTGAQITQLQDTLSLRFLSGGLDFFGSAPEPVNTSLAEFAWHPEVDDVDQRHKCMSFLQDHLLQGLGKAAGQISLEDASGDDTFLAIKDHRLLFTLRGKADFAIVKGNASKQHKENLKWSSWCAKTSNRIAIRRSLGNSPALE